MRFLILTHVKHKEDNGSYFGYEPYVKEMNIWLRHVDQVEVVAPLTTGDLRNIDLAYDHDDLIFNTIPAIDFTTTTNSLNAFLKTPLIFWRIFRACRKADHIHLRCPGIVGLIGCFVQILFPSKPKTAKYAGNWDPKSKQPLSYRLQKKILSNTFLTKNMKVLVYGEYPHQTSNIIPFFTASFYRKDIAPIASRNYQEALQFMFVGSMVEGKRPMLALQIVEQLIQNHVDASMEFYGDGVLLEKLKSYAAERGLSNQIRFFGNQPKAIIKEALKSAHFLVLPSKSEGWPKVIAEAMFFGAIPIATKISCIPFMLDEGKRGILIDPDVETAAGLIRNSLNSDKLKDMQINAISWSQTYTLDRFDAEIKKLLKD